MCTTDLQVILIHLSNLTGLGHYNKRTMRLIVSDIGTSAFGSVRRMAVLCADLLPPGMVSSNDTGLERHKHNQFSRLERRIAALLCAAKGI